MQRPSFRSYKLSYLAYVYSDNSTKEIKRVVLDIVFSALPHYLNLRVIKLITEVSLVLDSAYICHLNFFFFCRVR